MLLALTGATGFIGQYLLRELPKRGHRVRALLRRPAALPPQTAGAIIGDLARPQNMSAALEGVDAVIHSAGPPHGMSGIPEDDYRLLNTEATINLARAARRAGAKRFVFLSSMWTDRRFDPDRGQRTEADRRLWKIQTRGGARPCGTRPRLGVIACGAGVRAWRQGQYGAADPARPVSLSIAACQPRGAPLAARPGKPCDSDRDCPGSAGNTAAGIHSRRSRGIDGCGDDCGLAWWARARAERFSAAAIAARPAAPGCRPRRGISAHLGLAGC